MDCVLWRSKTQRLATDEPATEILDRGCVTLLVRSMSIPPGHIHIIAVGPGQLLTGVAALRSQGIDPAGGSVFYRGIPSSAIDAVMNRLCVAYHLRYAGLANASTFVAGRGGLVGLFDACEARIAPRQYLKRRLGKVWAALNLLKSDVIVISVRHNTPEDAFLLAALEPPRIIFTADGVIVGAPQTRRFRSAERIALGPLGEEYPLLNDVWTPSYLHSFVTKIGRPRAISDDTLRDVFASAQFAAASLAPTGYKHVVLGQHLALSGLATELEEQAVWADIFRHLSRLHPGATLLYKAHPRDRSMKRVLLSRSLPVDMRVLFTTNENWALPLEAMTMAPDTHVYGLSSSALLYAAYLGQPASLLCCRHWPDPLVDEITGFGAESALPIEWVDEY